MLKDEKENMMAKYYLAPMEGITTYIFRNAYHKYFRKMDKYYTPFFVPHSKRGLNLKEQEEILPAHNAGLFVVPQILSNNGNDCQGRLHQNTVAPDSLQRRKNWIDFWIPYFRMKKM